MAKCQKKVKNKKLKKIPDSDLANSCVDMGSWYVISKIS